MRYVYKINNEKFESLQNKENVNFTIPFVTEHRSLFIGDTVDLWNSNQEVKSFDINGVEFSKNNTGELVTKFNLYGRK